MSEQSKVIAIDGPSASGKSTVAKAVAARLGYIYVDSGAVYRGVTWETLRQGIDPQDGEAVARVVESIRMEFTVASSRAQFTIDGRDPGMDLRGADVSAQVSPVAAVPAVRRRVVAWLRDMQAFGDLVMEGRDIGTAVFPEAPCKFYLDASAEARARRRHAEVKSGSGAGEGGGQSADLASVGEALQRRDRIDSTRKIDPLQVAADAQVIDSTSMSIDQVVQCVLERLGADDAEKSLAPKGLFP